MYDKMRNSQPNQDDLVFENLHANFLTLKDKL